MAILPTLIHPIIMMVPDRVSGEDDRQVRQLPFLLFLLELLRPRSVVDLDIGAGDRFWGLCQGIGTLGIAATCVGVDTADPSRPAEDEALNARYGFATLHQSPEQAAADTADSSIDLLLVDGRSAQSDDLAGSWRSKLHQARALLVVVGQDQDAATLTERWEATASRDFGATTLLSFSSQVPARLDALFTTPAQEWGQVVAFLEAVADRTRAVARHEHRSDSGTALAEARSEIHLLTTEVASLRDLLGYTQSEIRDLHNEIARLHQISADYALSTSWKITAPVRAAASVVRRIRGKATPLTGDEGISYEEWRTRFATPGKGDLRAIRADAATTDGPLISVLMPVYNPPASVLRRAVESVIEQIYPRWELCIADDASTDPDVPEVLEACRALDARIRVVTREQNGHISAASNSALEIARGDFVALLDHDDELAPEALWVAAKEITRDPDVNILYSDEDKLDYVARRYDPFFKTPFDPALILGQNFICHLGIYRRSLVDEVGGFRMGYEGSQDYDLALRCIARSSEAQIRHIPRVLYHWRAGEGSTAMSGDEKPYAVEAGRRAVRDYLTQSGARATVAPAQIGAYNRVRFALPDPLPTVSIIIPTKNGVSLLRRCIASIVEKSTYPNLDILVVDNGSDDPATLSYLDELQAADTARVLRYDAPFNYSRLNNFAAEQAQGEFLLLLNNDTEVISPDWIEELVGWGSQPWVGTVGCMLLYHDHTVQHAGITLGIGGVAGHFDRGLPDDSPGAFGRLALAHCVDGNTGACLLVRRQLYLELGGLNEEALAVAFNDVDFGLRISEHGLRNVWTPFARLYHHESKTRGYEDTPQKRERFATEYTYMRSQWGRRLRADRNHSPNITLATTNYGLAIPPRVPPLATLVDTKR